MPKLAASISISSPELPAENILESLNNGQLNEQDRYANLVLSNQNLAGQIAPSVSIVSARFQDVGLEDLRIGAEELQGAIIDSLQMIALARDFAHLLGLKVLE